MYVLTVKSWWSSRTNLRSLVVYAFPCLFVWSFYFLAFYPGMMSQDSIGQWRPVQTFEFDDWHSAFLSYLYWLLSRIWNTPAVVCIAQMLGLAAVFTYGMVQLEKKGLPAWASCLMVLFFSLFPLNGYFVNTLFKDTPFTIGYLLIFIYLMLIVDSGGVWLSKVGNIIWFSLALSFIWLVRHNGILTVLTTVAGMFFLYPRYFKKLGLLVFLTIALVFLVKVPLYKSLNVEGRFYGLEMIMTHQIGAVINSRAPLNPEEKAFLQKILPLPIWQYNYNPFFIDPMIFNDHFENYYSFLNSPSNRNKFIKVWYRIARRNIWVLVKHQIKVTDLVWNVGLQDGSYIYSIHPGIDPNNLGLKTQSVLPKLKNKLVAFADYAYKNSFLFVVLLRPATYIYSGILFLFLIFWYTRKKEIALMVIPFVAIVGGVLLTIPAQHVRYLYPCFLLTPFFAAYFILVLEQRGQLSFTQDNSLKQSA